MFACQLRNWLLVSFQRLLRSCNHYAIETLIRFPNIFFFRRMWRKAKDSYGTEENNWMKFHIRPRLRCISLWFHWIFNCLTTFDIVLFVFKRYSPPRPWIVFAISWIIECGLKSEWIRSLPNMFAFFLKSRATLCAHKFIYLGHFAVIYFRCSNGMAIFLL